jgi:hypothetical protein
MKVLQEKELQAVLSNLTAFPQAMQHEALAITTTVSYK